MAAEWELITRPFTRQKAISRHQHDLVYPINDRHDLHLTTED